MQAPLPSHEANATGTLRVLEAARALGVGRVVYAGSSSAYGDTPVLPKVETMAPLPLSPYAVSKLAGELYCQMYARTFGRRDGGAALLQRVRAAAGSQLAIRGRDPALHHRRADRRQPVIFGDGTQSRDFCFIDNVVEANLRAAEAHRRQVSGRVFNIACGAATDLNTVVRLIGELHRQAADRALRAGPAGRRQALAGRHRAPRASLGYQPRVLFAEGLRAPSTGSGVSIAMISMTGFGRAQGTVAGSRRWWWRSARSTTAAWT